MRILLALLGLVLLNLIPIYSIGQRFNYQMDFKTILKRTTDQKDDLFHEKLAKRFAKNDTSLTDFEVLALLINFTSNKNYAPYEILSAEDQITEQVKSFQFEDAINMCDSILKIHPYNQQILFNKAFSYFSLKKLDSAEFYKYQFNRIMDAMAFSGSGSREDPIFSLGSKDSENYIYERLAKQIMSIGSGTDSSGNFLDIIEITDFQTDTLTLHFQIQHAVNRLINTNKGNK